MTSPAPENIGLALDRTESAGGIPAGFAPHQANRLVDRGLQRWRELVAKSTDLADRGPDEHDFGQSPASQYGRKGHHQMMDSDGMEAELRAGRVEYVQANSTDLA